MCLFYVPERDGENKYRLACLAMSIPEVKCAHCIKITQMNSLIIEANQTTCIHHVLKVLKTRLIRAKISKIDQELENRDHTCLG